MLYVCMLIMCVSIVHMQLCAVLVSQNLVKACKEGDVQTVHWLLLGGVDPNQADEVLSYCNLHMVYTNTDKQTCWVASSDIH